MPVDKNSIGSALIATGLILIFGAIGAETKLSSVAVDLPLGRVEVVGIKGVSAIMLGAGIVFVAIGVYLLQSS